MLVGWPQVGQSPRLLSPAQPCGEGPGGVIARHVHSGQGFAEQSATANGVRDATQRAEGASGLPPRASIDMASSTLKAKREAPATPSSASFASPRTFCSAISLPNLPSGGKASVVEVGEFLSRGHGPEQQALLRLIGSLVEPGL